MRLDGVNSVRLGGRSLCHQARPGEVELLHKVQAGIQAQCRVLHQTDRSVLKLSQHVQTQSQCPHSHAGDCGLAIDQLQTYIYIYLPN